MARIGVEESLTHVKQVLIEMGHEVVDLRSESDAAGCDCCIVTGMDENVMGIQDASIGGPVINAHGYSAEAICQMVDEKLS
ncbi:UPF0180 protein [Compostibacillus humi]|uniref:UPF0180 protein GCM10010978_08720 n=1 Tax=Compostibacillus humi TaxID=1245525 RepID=A0A8J2ZQM8_9BACI|nr:YkuS family protein [Compostibacillus humi]GGH72110.1 UPF0180 protein [Compostibacillus humi]